MPKINANRNQFDLDKFIEEYKKDTINPLDIWGGIDNISKVNCRCAVIPKISDDPIGDKDSGKNKCKSQR